MEDIKWPDELIRALYNEKLAIFFGAGLGLEYGLPSWGSLTESLVDELQGTKFENYQKVLRKLLESAQYLEVIDHLRYFDEVEGTNKLNNRIIEKISETQIGSDSETNQDLLFKLNSSIFLTTNVDNTLSQSKAKAGKITSQIYCYENIQDIKTSLLTNDLIKQPLIVQLHGQLSTQSSLVFSKERYTDILTNGNYFFKQTLPAILNTHTVLFIGYGLEDLDINLLLKKFNQTQSHSLSMFWLQFDKDLNPKKVSDIFKLGIKVIECPMAIDNHNRTQALKHALKDLLCIQSGMTRENKRHVLHSSVNIRKFISEQRSINQL